MKTTPIHLSLLRHRSSTCCRLVSMERNQIMFDLLSSARLSAIDDILTRTAFADLL